MEFKEFLNRLVEGEDLKYSETENLFNRIMEGKLSDVQTAGILVALRAKGETVEEVTAAAKVMREKSLKVPLPEDIRKNLVDTCGTGGDLKGTFNISTAVALVVAACGVPVAKHGNRSVSSKCGSADILESFGVRIDLKPEQVAECIKKLNFGFMFAPVFHPAMASVARVRKELKIRTVFNILGPLTNPARSERQLLGVFSEKLTEKLATVLKNLGVKRAFVVHGLDGMDEITLCAPTKVTELKEGKIRTYTITPEEFGFRSVGIEELRAGDSLYENKEIIRKILAGEDESPRRDIVALNAAFALVAAGAVGNVKEAVSQVLNVISTGKPYELLCKIVKLTNEL